MFNKLHLVVLAALILGISWDAAAEKKKATAFASVQISSFSPTYGSPGTNVTIYGFGFTEKAKDVKVKLNDKLCQIVNLSDKQIIVQVPDDNPKSGPFVIEVKGKSKYEHSQPFVVTYPPVVFGFKPEAGFADAEVVINGDHFGNDPRVVQVFLANRGCKVISVNENEIRFQVPRRATSGELKVVVPRMGEAKSAKNFEVWNDIAVTKIDPMFGLPGEEIRVNGTGFTGRAKDHLLFFEGARAEANRIESGSLVFKVPSDAPDGAVGLKLEIKQRGSVDIPVQFNVLHTPEIRGFNPERGPVGTEVSISGDYFGTKPTHVKVLLGGVTVPVTSVEQNEIRLIVPDGATSGNFEIQTRRRGSAVSKGTFEIYIPIMVIGFTPAIGSVGQTVTMSGSGFDENPGNNIVTINGKKAEVTQASFDVISFVVPKGATSGSFRVEVPGRGFFETTESFSVVDQIRITSFNPKAGAPGALVTIKGKGFDKPDLRGYLGQTPIGVRVDSPTQVTISVPQGAKTGRLSLTAVGVSRGEAGSDFQVLAPLTITGFYPPYGQVGTRVAIYGSGFDLRRNATSISCGGRQLPIQQGSTEAMLVVAIPDGVGSGNFRVRVKGRGEAVSQSMFVTTYPMAAAPVAPAASPWGGGYAPPPMPAPVVYAPPPVQPMAQPVPQAAPVPPPPEPLPEEPPLAQVPAETTTEAPAPAETPAKPASMDALMGIDEASQGISIASIDPPEGAPEDVIMVNGSGFGEDANKVKVWIGDKQAKVTGVVPDMLMVEVPSGCRSGKIKVKIGDKFPVTSKDSFKVVQ